MSTSKIETQSENPILSDPAYSVTGAALIIGVSNRTIHLLLKDGCLNSLTVQRRKLIKHSEIERFLNWVHS